MKHAAILGVLLAAQGVASPAFAAGPGPDMRLGSFEMGTWCGYAAYFYVETREGDTWVFHGHVHILDTGQYDPIWIEQYSDNSLRIIRYLQGANLGQTQVVQTHPPYEEFYEGAVMTTFMSRVSNGYGCGDAEKYSVFYIQ